MIQREIATSNIPAEARDHLRGLGYSDAVIADAIRLLPRYEQAVGDMLRGSAVADVEATRAALSVLSLFPKPSMPAHRPCGCDQPDESEFFDPERFEVS